MEWICGNWSCCDDWWPTAWLTKPRCWEAPNKWVTGFPGWGNRPHGRQLHSQSEIEFGRSVSLAIVFGQGKEDFHSKNVTRNKLLYISTGLFTYILNIFLPTNLNLLVCNLSIIYPNCSLVVLTLSCLKVLFWRKVLNYINYFHSLIINSLIQ